MKNIDLAARISAAKEKIRVADAWRLLSLPTPPRAGNICVRSPFRPEKNASFGIFAEGRAFKDHADDTAKGDVINFIKLAARCGTRDAIATLLEWAGDREPLGHRKHTGAITGFRKAAALVVPPPPPPPPLDPEVEEGPPMDPFEGSFSISPSEKITIAIAASRRLPASATARLSEAGILRIIADNERQWVLCDGPEMPRDMVLWEKRNFDRRPFRHGGKAHTFTGAIKKWPMGLSLAMKDPLQTIIIVEGGPDLLAAYALIEHLGRHDCVAVAILGREIKQLIPEARRVFAGRLVHIIPHRDKDTSGELTSGREAAVEWEKMLTDDCGAAADVTWSPLEVLTRPDGRPAKDLCEAVEDGGIERNRAHWDDLMPDRNEQEAGN